MDDSKSILLFTLSLALAFSSSVAQYYSYGSFPLRGKCGQMSPCSQICEDLPHGYFKCDCWKGHKLARNGFMCIDDDIKTDVKVKSSLQGDDPNAVVQAISLDELDHNKVIQALESAAKEMAEEMENSVNTEPVPCGEQLSCLNSGQCAQNPITESPICQCPLGTLGKQCQIDSIKVKYPQLWGAGYVAFPKLLTAYKTFKISVEFRPTKLNGLLLFSSERPTARGDFFSVALIDGRVEFRFNCGTGAAIIRSNYTVTPDEWHELTVYRSRFNGWIKVNDEEPVAGTSPGLYNRITLREMFYLGGYKNLTAISKYTGIDRGFAGCVKSLTVNEHQYDMRKRIEKTNKRGQVVSQIGDIIEGVNVGEGSSSVCKDVTCHGGGTCVTDTVDTYVCLCPLGRAGTHCEQEITIHIPSFNGTSYMTYQGLTNTKLSYVEIEVVFRPRVASGLILYDALRTDTTGDFISLAMSDGHLEFRFDCGTGPAIVRSHNMLSLDEWHTAVFSRTGLEGILEVDGHPPVVAKAEGAFTQTSFKTDLYLGGHNNWDEMAKAAAANSSFIGDIQKVVVNDKPIDLVEDALVAININNADHPCIGSPCLHGDCVPDHDVYTCDCYLGYSGDNCEIKLSFSDDASEFEFQGRSYMHLTHPDILKRVTGSKIDVKLSVRTTESEGLILWTGQSVMTPSSDYLALGLEQGHLKWSYNLGSGEAVIISNETINNGEWHRIHIRREGVDGTMTVDSEHTVTGTSPGKLKQLNTNNGLYLGGMNDIVELSLRRYASGFVGCLQSVTLATDYHLDLIADVSEGRNVRECV